MGGWGHAARSVTCPARRSSGRSRTRRLHMSVSFNSRGSGAAPLKLMPAPLPPKSHGAFLLASLPGPSGPHNSAPRTPFLHPARSAACAPHPAPCTRSSTPGASSATYGNPLSARSGTASRPRPMPPRNRTEPGLGGRGRLASGVTLGTPD